MYTGMLRRNFIFFDT